MDIKDIRLDLDEYFPVDFKKSTIYLHHTAGSYRPDYVAQAWNRDKYADGSTKRIATAFIIGGKGKNNDAAWDGIVVRCFPESQWAWHLGAKGTNGMFDKISIGIEICNFGQLSKSKTGQFMTYVNTPLPEDQVAELKTPFRGFKYYHKYTDSQLDSLRELLIYLGTKYGINLKMGLQEWINKENLIMPNNLSVLQQQKWLNLNGFVGKNGKRLSEDGAWGANSAFAVNMVGKSAFEYNPLTMMGYGGIWSHSNIRVDKNDISPQLNMINMLKSL